MNVEVLFDVDGNCLGPRLPTWGTPGYDGPFFVAVPLELPVGFSFANRTLTEMEAISAEQCRLRDQATEDFYAREAAREEREAFVFGQRLNTYALWPGEKQIDAALRLQAIEEGRDEA